MNIFLIILLISSTTSLTTYFAENSNNSNNESKGFNKTIFTTFYYIFKSIYNRQYFEKKT